ncbi:MAG: SRPBCC family protein [Candidatus Acidiferrales bacterium]
MSDHIDGPRQIGDPASDLTDLFAFTSPENSAHTVLAANVFPSAGVTAMFSNAVNHSIVVRRASLAGSGNHTKFKAGDKEYRFSCKFDVLERDGEKTVQRGTLTCPDGQTIRFVVNDEKGASTPDGVYRIFAGLRSDPFLLAWVGMKKVPNLLQHDNVLAIVIEFDTQRVLHPTEGSLFGVIAETTPLGAGINPVERPPLRYDWVGRPEQTNMRLNNGGLKNVDDLRDLWNQQTPFAIADEFKPVFRKRLVDSLTEWDMRDGNADWTPAAIAAAADVYLDDFILFDVSKPFSDSSYLEIEKSALRGKPHETGGGRTIDANVVDIMVSWWVNNDREFLHGGSASPTKPSTKTFPYEASPNTELQTVADSVDLAASPDQVWAVIGQFGNLMWHPLLASEKLTGTGVGQLRTVETIDGKQIVERLEFVDDAQRLYRYTSVSGIGVADYMGTFDAKPKGSGTSVEWRVQFLADNQPTLIVKVIESTLMKTGFEALQKRFGALK